MATSNGKSKKRTQKEADKDLSKTYNQFKEFEGHKYTGMKIDRSHKWYYDKGEWKETKVTPDLWTINFAVTKRRAGKAPEGCTGRHRISLVYTGPSACTKVKCE